jgi:hypothetical protein
MTVLIRQTACEPTPAASVHTRRFGIGAPGVPKGAEGKTPANPYRWESRTYG